MELFAVLVNSLSIVGVDDVDEALGVGVVVSPQKSDLVLTTDIPNVERDVLVLDSLDVEADRGDSVDYLTELKLVEDRGLAGGVETHHEDAHLASANHTLPDFAEKGTHYFVVLVFVFKFRSNPVF